jgi:hypothetical protein
LQVQSNSVGAHLGSALQNAEPATNYDTATHPTEEGEIQQQFPPAAQINTDLTAAQIIPFSSITANMESPSPEYLHHGQNNYQTTNNSHPNQNPNNTTTNFSPSHYDHDAQHSSLEYLHHEQNKQQTTNNSHSKQNLNNTTTKFSSSHNNNDANYF